MPYLKRLQSPLFGLLKTNKNWKDELLKINNSERWQESIDIMHKYVPQLFKIFKNLLNFAIDMIMHY